MNVRQVLYNWATKYYFFFVLINLPQKKAPIICINGMRTSFAIKSKPVN
jgi:hypothetical protein